ncbi:MAG: hypothetical protein IPI67_12725 [Myxococcales bacterium]|nr:hypothetical protein [Myxococcales bacterium]
MRARTRADVTLAFLLAVAGCAAREPGPPPARSIVVPEAASEPSEPSTAPPPASASSSGARSLECKVPSEQSDLEAAKRTFSAGVNAYQDGDFASAADAFARSYVLSCKSPLLHNLSKAEEQLGDFAAAAHTLELYLQRDPSVPQAEDVRRRIDELRRRAGGPQR